MTSTTVSRPSLFQLTQSWNIYTRAEVDRVWEAIAAVFQGLAGQPSWRTNADGQQLLVVQETAALGQARQLGFTVSADLRQPACEVDWQVRAVDGGSMVTLTVHDPEAGWEAEVERAWLPLLDRLAAVLDGNPSA